MIGTHSYHVYTHAPSVVHPLAQIVYDIVVLKVLKVHMSQFKFHSCQQIVLESLLFAQYLLSFQQVLQLSKRLHPTATP